MWTFTECQASMFNELFENPTMEKKFSFDPNSGCWMTLDLQLEDVWHLSAAPDGAFPLRPKTFSASLQRSER